MSRLEDLLALVQARLNANMVAVYPDGIDYGFGLKEVSENTTPPRIVFVPDDWTDGPAQGGIGGNPKTLATHGQPLKALIWGDSFGAAEELVFQLKTALIEECGASNVSLSLLGGRWIEDRHADMGWGAEQRFAFRIPVTEALTPTVTLGDPPFSHTTGFEGSGQSGCSS